jgi:hypothetical protein
LIIFKDEYLEFPFSFPCKTRYDVQMDFIFSPQNNRHVVLCFSPNEQAVYVHKLHTGETKHYSTFPHLLFTHYWICGENGQFLVGTPDSLLDCWNDVRWSDTVLCVNFLYNIGKWAVRMVDTYFVLDREGMQHLLKYKNRARLISSIDAGDLDCMYTSPTSLETRFTEDHSVMIYVFKQRICLAQTIYPFLMFPVTRIGLERCDIDPVRIRYIQSENILQIFCTSRVYTFSMFAKSLTASTSTATTFE